MSEHLHPGTHLEPDSLSALLEGALPEHERAECLAHLAACSQCREVAFLAQEPQPAVVVPKPAPWWRRWLAPIPVLSGAVACAIAAGAWFYLHRAPVAPVQYAAASPAATPPVAAASPVPQPAPRPQVRSLEAPRLESPAPISAPALASTAPPPPPPMPSASSQAGVAFGGVMRLSVQHNQGSVGDLSEVAGSVTDPSGAVIPKANITLREVTGKSIDNTQTDESGRFKIAALPPGRYELQITAQGFQKTSSQIELQARDLALVSPVLSVGSTSETVTVEASAAAPIQTSAATRPPLAESRISELPVVNRSLVSDGHPVGVVTRGKLLLKADSAGALLFSKDAGKHWKTVKPLWQGKVVQLGTRAESPTNPEAFQVMTDSGSVWLSRDGTHWYPDSPQR
jgi:hypothetical protein